MIEFDPGDQKVVVIKGESGEEYESVHEDGPIDLGGGTDTLQIPTTQG